MRISSFALPALPSCLSVLMFSAILASGTLNAATCGPLIFKDSFENGAAAGTGPAILNTVPVDGASIGEWDH